MIERSNIRFAPWFPERISISLILYFFGLLFLIIGVPEDVANREEGGTEGVEVRQSHYKIYSMEDTVGCSKKHPSERFVIASVSAENLRSEKFNGLKQLRRELSSELLHCYFCEYSCQTKQGLSRHICGHLPSYICMVCEAEFRSERTLASHKKCKHGSTKPSAQPHSEAYGVMEHLQMSDSEFSKDFFHCYFCEYSSQNKIGLSKHVQGHLPPHICSMCDLKFRSERKLLAHNKCEHPESKNPQKRRVNVMEDTYSRKNKPFSEYSTYCNNVGISKHMQDHSPPNTCSVSNVKFRSELKFTALQKCEHPSQKQCAKTDGFLENQRTSQSELNCEMFQCYFCLHSFQTKQGLSRHLQSHLPSYICMICNAKFRTERTLLAHEKGGHSEIKKESEFGKELLHCYLCDYSSRNKAGLSKHIKGHLPPHICSMCDTKFRSERKLVAHEKREHPKIYKRRKLSAQPHEFMEDTRLGDQHKKTTVDEKPTEFPCYHCQWSTSVWDDLVEHMKDNHLPSANNCTLCSFKANTRIMLIRHLMETHKLEKPYLCDICDYSSKFASGLKYHKAKHTGEMLHAGNMCDFRTDFAFHLTKHRQEHLDKKGEKRFDCDICTYSATTFCYLQQHRRIHTGEKPYACDMCDYRSARLADRNAHRRTHTGERPFMCDICDYSSGRLCRLKQHRRIHFGEKPYACDLCDYCATRNQSVMDHMRYHHNRTGGKHFACDECDYKTVRKSDLRKHVLTHEGDLKQKKLYRCEICNVTADSETTLSAHMKTHEKTHSGDAGRGKPYACDLCSYHAETLMEMSLHKRTHPSDKPHPCALCDYRASKAEYLRLHYRKHELTHKGNPKQKKLYRCEICNVTADSETTLSAHMKTHEKTHSGDAGRGKPYACDLCSYHAETLMEMSLHKRTHPSDKPHPCALCDYRASKAVYLRLHYRKHTGEKPYACDKCDFRTHLSQNLQYHLKLHQNKRPFPCDLCDYSAARASRLACHKRIHTGEKPFACSVCAYRSTCRQSLRTHMRSHTGDEPYACDWCDFRTKSAALLAFHIKKEHPENLYACGECSFQDFSRHKVEQHLTNCHPTIGLGRPVPECVTNLKGTVTLLFNCPECSFNHRSRSLVENHLSECHLDVDFAESRIWASAQWDSD